MIYTLGETVYDIVFKNAIPQKSLPGGSALNTSVSVGRVAKDVCFISELGNDYVAQIIIDFLADNNVNTDYITRYDCNTSIALAFLNEQNDASYIFHKNLPLQRKLTLPIIKRGDVIIFSSSFAVNMQIRQQLMEFLISARNEGAIIIYDPNVRIKSTDDKEKLVALMRENIAIAHIVKGSDDDFAAIYNESLGSSVFEKIGGEKVLFYTKNKEGAEVHTSKSMFDSKAMNIIPLSTIGAGDNFTAAILYMLKEHSISTIDLLINNQALLHDILELGISFAGNVCQSFDNFIDFDFAQSIREVSK
ncbi:MAG: hypothetical protein IPO21_11965 [Bacteroidales bacterium]|nr:hypothetical protein [Bacteroidales bacterium]